MLSNSCVIILILRTILKLSFEPNVCACIIYCFLFQTIKDMIFDPLLASLSLNELKIFQF